MYALELAFSDDPARLEGRPAHRDRLVALRVSDPERRLEHIEHH